MKNHLIKRSFRLAGHATSIALEAEFWAVLEATAAQQGKSLAALVAEVDTTRASQGLPLASALRLTGLAHARTGQAVAIRQDQSHD
jgi:predicted DNA-binding ribbon-helix-helix protein